MNTQNIMKDIEFLMSDEVEQEDKDNFIDDHTTVDGFII